MKRGVLPAIMISTFCATVGAAAHAQSGDACDFSAGGPIFPYSQVLSCFHRVPFSPSDLDGTVRAIEQQRSFSDLAGIYDERIHWRSALAGVARTEFIDDVSMQVALADEHRRFRNPHVSYFAPSCYAGMLLGFVPLEFGSTLADVGSGPEQIIFVEDGLALLPELVDAYSALTGVDTSAFVGQRVVSINGTPVLDYFREFTRRARTQSDDGGGLNSLLQDFEYSVRQLDYNGLPDREADVYVFESRQGERRQVALPWAFFPYAALGVETAPALTTSTDEFVALCQQGAPDAEAAVGARPRAWLGDRTRLDRQRLLDRITVPTHRTPVLVPNAVSSTPPQAEPSAFFEAPPEGLFQGIEEIVPRTGSAQVFQLGQDVTVLRVFDTLGWVDVARVGLQFACENSQRLIVDVRSNGGGADTVIRWLHHALFPEQGSLIGGGLLPLSLRNDDPVFNEILFNFAAFTAAFPDTPGLSACDLLVTPGCLTDAEEGGVIGVSELDWFRSPSRDEVRAGEPILMSRQFGLPTLDDAVFDAASCAGRFQGDALIFITNGTNASGGYFLPAAFTGEAVIVGTGGFAGEPMVMGNARGGATMGSLFQPAAEAIELASEGAITFEHELVGFPRPVDSSMEMLGAYHADRETLHIEEPISADLHVAVWTSSPGTEAFVYDRVLRAVDARAR
jgi:hypothetical protein